MRNGLTPNSPGLSGGRDASAASSPDPGLCVTVISTTQEGTTAALNAARWLGKNLEARITLLTMEVVPFHLPLDQPPLALEFTTDHQCSVTLGSNAEEKAVINRVYLCRDPEGDLSSVLRRRALVVIGGRRRWWLSSEERLERALRRLGHHVIFIDVADKMDPASNRRSAVFLGSSQFHNQAGGAQSSW